MEASEKPKEDPAAVYRQLKRYYRAKTGKSLGQPGSYGEAWQAAVERETGDVVFGAACLWVDELNRTFARSLHWPFAVFMKHFQERIEDYRDKRHADADHAQEDDPYAGMKMLN